MSPDKKLEPSGEWQVVPHPGTGEAINLKTAETELLLEICEAYKVSAHATTEWRRAAEDEIIRRLDEAGKKLAIVGDLEVRVRNNNEAVWDVDDLGLVLYDLVTRGLIGRRQAEGIIVKTTTVARGPASKLMDSLLPTSEAYRELDRCRTWRRRSRRTIETALVPNLEDALPEAT